MKTLNREKTITKLKEIIYTYENKTESNKLSEFAEGRLSAFRFSLKLIKNNQCTEEVDKEPINSIPLAIEIASNILHLTKSNYKLKKENEKLTKELKVLIALNLLDSDGDSYDDMTFAELSKIRKERISELKQIDKKMKEMAITIRRSTAGGGNYKF